MRRFCILMLAVFSVASLAPAQQPGRAAEIQESLQTRYRLTRIGPSALGMRGSEKSIRHAGGVVLLRKDGLFGSLKRNQLISMSITGNKVEVLSGPKEGAVPLTVGGRFYVVAVTVSSDAITIGLLSTESVTSSGQAGQLWASLNFFFDKDLIQRGDVSRIYPELDEWLLPEGTGIAASPAVAAAAASPAPSKSDAPPEGDITRFDPGMSRDEVVKKFGAPRREISFGEQRWLQYQGLTFSFIKNALTRIDSNAEPAIVKITSEPDGAEIYIGGNFAGTTPSTLKLPPESAQITVKHAGFTNWERQLQINAGSEINLHATLSK